MSGDLPVFVIWADYSEAAHRAAAERFARHAHSERAIPVLRRWGAWSKTPEGRSVFAKLGALADDLLCGDITSEQYAQALFRLAPLTPVPQVDLEILARLALEFDRCCFFGAGDVPIVDVDPAEYVGGA